MPWLMAKQEGVVSCVTTPTLVNSRPIRVKVKVIQHGSEIITASNTANGWPLL